MQLSEKARRAAAKALYDAELTLQWVPRLKVKHPEADIEDAYSIGQYVTDLKVAAGRKIKGHKVGYTSAAMREAFDVDEPDYGTIFDNWFVPEGSQVSMSRMNRPFVELELVFVLKTGLSGPDINELDVIRATDFIVPAIEICDGRQIGESDWNVIDSIADAAGCGFVVVGGNPIDLRTIDPRHIGGTLYINGAVRMSGTGAAVMGNPISAVAWLARKLHHFGVGMDAGHSILSGSFTSALRVRAADTITADFGALGQISLGFTE